MNWLHNIFTTPEQVISFINESNFFFIFIIIAVAIYSDYKYKKTIKEINYYDYVYSRFTNVGAATNTAEERTKWDNVKKAIKSKDENLRPSLLLSILNQFFAKDIALNLKKANSWFEGLASLGLFGTVFGLLIGAAYSNGSNLEVMISSFSTALITTFFGLLAQLVIRMFACDVEAENAVEVFQGKMLQLEKLALRKPEILSNSFLDGIIEKNSNSEETGKEK